MVTGSAGPVVTELEVLVQTTTWGLGPSSSPGAGFAVRARLRMNNCPSHTVYNPVGAEHPTVSGGCLMRLLFPVLLFLAWTIIPYSDHSVHTVPLSLITKRGLSQ